MFIFALFTKNSRLNDSKAQGLRGSMVPIAPWYFFTLRLTNEISRKINEQRVACIFACCQTNWSCIIRKKSAVGITKALIEVMCSWSKRQSWVALKLWKGKSYVEVVEKRSCVEVVEGQNCDEVAIKKVKEFSPLANGCLQGGIAKSIWLLLAGGLLGSDAFYTSDIGDPGSDQ